MQLQFFLPELILHKYSVEGYVATPKICFLHHVEAKSKLRSVGTQRLDDNMTGDDDGW